MLKCRCPIFLCPTDNTSLKHGRETSCTQGHWLGGFCREGATQPEDHVQQPEDTERCYFCKVCISLSNTVSSICHNLIIVTIKDPSGASPTLQHHKFTSEFVLSGYSHAHWGIIMCCAVLCCVSIHGGAVGGTVTLGSNPLAGYCISPLICLYADTSSHSPHMYECWDRLQASTHYKRICKMNRQTLTFLKLTVLLQPGTVK